MTPALGETIYPDFIISSGTGAAADADSLPTAAVYENTNDTAILSPTVVKRVSLTGNYYVPIVCTTGNGFEEGKSYNVIGSATVGGIAAKAVLATFQVRTMPANLSLLSIDASGRVDLGKWLGTAATAPVTPGKVVIDASAITAATLAAELIAGGVASVANQTTILARLGAFAGTGVNTVIGFLRAMANKAAGVATPSELSASGAFTNTTDSLEAVADGVAASGDGAQDVDIDENDMEIRST